MNFKFELGQEVTHRSMLTKFTDLDRLPTQARPQKLVIIMRGYLERLGGASSYEYHVRVIDTKEYSMQTGFTSQTFPLLEDELTEYPSDPIIK